MLLCMVACGPTAGIDQIVPADARSGTMVRVHGHDLPDNLEAAFVRGQSAIPALSRRIDANTYDVEIDAALPSAQWELALVAGEKVVAAAPMRVWRTSDEPPCRKRYQLEASIGRIAQRIDLTRTFADGESEIERIPVSSVDHLELASDPATGPEVCSSLAARLTDGRWVLIADDHGAGLAAKAAGLAATLSLELVDTSRR